jgi:hypothetical protein
MGLDEIKGTAFYKWACLQNPETLFYHLIECLKQGGANNIVWDLFTALGLKAVHAESIMVMVRFLQQ